MFKAHNKKQLGPQGYEITLTEIVKCTMAKYRKERKLSRDKKTREWMF